MIFFSRKESVRFTPARGIHRNLMVVHAHGVNPVDCANAAIVGGGLGEEEITISFAKMFHREIKAQETGTILPLSTERLFEWLDKYDPIKKIYNAI